MDADPGEKRLLKLNNQAVIISAYILTAF
ncbi:hypothetical protein ELI_0976 [Eubacterium callanderi]|uniref:Uncharacterized protein n=1 Tax=Eubacterium callanderi TaxID=53442 RepID=E3GKH2_9FIRM|nr:hypothetical protein ELI_0976 [Eubacterium callanderi]